MRPGSATRPINTSMGPTDDECPAAGVGSPCKYLPAAPILATTLRDASGGKGGVALGTAPLMTQGSGVSSEHPHYKTILSTRM